MRYNYVRNINFGSRFVDLRPLSQRFLSEGLFDPEMVARSAAPWASRLPGEAEQCGPDYAAPATARPTTLDPTAIGPDILAPFDSLDELQNGRQPPDRITRRLEALDQEWRRQQERRRSRWTPPRPGPPPRAIPPANRATPLPPLGRGATARGGAAALVATAAIALNRVALVEGLRNRLDGLAGPIGRLMKDTRFRQVLCTALYSFYSFTDDIGNNDPRLASLSVLTPPDLRGGSVGIGSAFDQFDFLLRPPPPKGQQQLTAGPVAQRSYGAMSTHLKPNRIRAIGYIFVSR